MNAKKLLTLSSLLLAGLVSAPALMAKGPKQDKGDTIVDIAAGNPAFSTLVAAVIKTDLLATLDGQRQFTVFAPTNDAFDAAAAVLTAGFEGGPLSGLELVDALPVEDLRNILLFHVAPGERFSDDVLGSERIRTLAKAFIMVDGLTLSGSTSANLVTDPEGLIDIDAVNGVVHVIDFVLLP